MKYLRLTLIALAIALAVILTTRFPTSAQVTPPIPTTTTTFNGTTVQVPDWTKITFNTLPAILEGGSIAIPTDLAHAMGYHLNRTWQAGDLPPTFIFLGDVADAFGLQNLTPQAIAQLTGFDTLATPLARYLVMGWQNPQTLVQAIPALANLALSQVPPLAQLFGNEGSTVAQAISNNPLLANTPLADALDLTQFSLQDIPGAQDTPFADYAQWQDTPISGIPGLADVPFSDFPIPIPTGLSAIATHDISFGDQETAQPSAIAQSLYISGTMEPHAAATTLPVPPEPDQSTRYIELADLVRNGANLGKRWVAGRDQQVPGGYGFLSALNGGKEPTGLAVFPRIFKTVLLDTHESQGSADFGIYFRTCIHTLFVDSCSPFFIGPIPWIPARETEPIILGMQP